jgi:predicted transglutaminase-like cysteine proteinase
MPSQVNRSIPDKRLVMRCGLWALFAGCLTMTALLAQPRHDPARLREQLVARFDSSRAPLLDEWLAVVASTRSLTEEARLTRINDFINGNLFFAEDIGVWGQRDYWATPLEMIGQGSGDCEDFAIIKYVSLRMAGVASSKLRLVYSKARLDGNTESVWVAHMVLAYYATPTAEPLVLDNLDIRIQPASQRADMQAVFSFNSDGIFAGVSGGNALKAAAGIGRISRWEDAWRRILADGYL